MFWQYMSHNSAALAGVVKVTNHTGLREVEPARYSPSANRWICLDSFEHSLGIYGFRSIWPCLIVEVLVTRAKFLEPSDHCTWNNCAFITNIFGCFCGVMTQFKLKKNISSRMRLRCCSFICLAFKSRTRWSNG